MSDWAGIGRLLAKITPGPMLDRAATAEAKRLAVLQPSGDYREKMAEQIVTDPAVNATTLVIMAAQARAAARAAVPAGLMGPSFAGLANSVGGAAGAIGGASGVRIQGQTNKAPEVPEWDPAAKAMELFALDDYGVYGVKLNGDVCELGNKWNSEYNCEVTLGSLTHTISLEAACCSVGIINYANRPAPAIIHLDEIDFSLSSVQEFASWPGYVVFREAHVDLTKRFIISRISGMREEMSGGYGTKYTPFKDRLVGPGVFGSGRQASVAPPTIDTMVDVSKIGPDMNIMKL